jgi:hypothetical protein
MLFSLPAWPILPAFLRRQSVEPKPEPEPAPWPGNPRTVADDLRIAQANEATLAEQLRENRQLLDGNELVRRLDQAERRAQCAEAEHERVAAELAAAHTVNLRLRKQLDRDFGYDEAAIAAIESGTGEPVKASTT